MSASHTVVITGSSFGLGLAMARHFIAGGHVVYGCGRDEDTLARARRELPQMLALRADVSVAADRERLLAAPLRDGRGVDVLVNNAAISRAHDYTNDYTLSGDRARAELEINLAAPIELSRLFLQWRRAAGREAMPATIAMISTPGALFPLDANPLYSATKAGLHTFTLALRRHLRATEVKVVEVFPPALDTKLARELDVPTQAGHGPEVIDTVARASVEGILRGEATVLPHEQSAALYRTFARPFDDALLDRINAGVARRIGWDRSR